LFEIDGEGMKDGWIG